MGRGLPGKRKEEEEEKGRGERGKAVTKCKRTERSDESRTLAVPDPRAVGRRR